MKAYLYNHPMLYFVVLAILLVGIILPWMGAGYILFSVNTILPSGVSVQDYPHNQPIFKILLSFWLIGPTVFISSAFYYGFSSLQQRTDWLTEATAEINYMLWIDSDDGPIVGVFILACCFGFALPLFLLFMAVGALAFLFATAIVMPYEFLTKRLHQKFRY